ncbi:MAG TPA: hypothetical protein VK667_04515, partial [Ktedonobacteraceae bacterium]|nr:hypothetical protein [Ktedonobacteraceae bacterium]
RQYEREIAEFREKLRFVLDKIDATFLTNIADPPTLAGLLASELKEHPLSIWEENTKKEKELWLSVQ